MNAERRAKIEQSLVAECHELLDRELELATEHQRDTLRLGRYDSDSPNLYGLTVASAVRAATIAVIVANRTGGEPIETIRRHVDMHWGRVGVRGNPDAVIAFGRLERFFAEPSGS